MICLTDRDTLLLYELARFNCFTSKQAQVLGNFTSSQVLYRRTKLLIEHGYIQRRRYIYGLPGIYSITKLGLKAISSSFRISKIFIGTLEHNLAIVDCYIYFKRLYELNKDNFQSERELRQTVESNDHYPDLVFNHENKSYCVEVEFTLKNKDRFKKNIKSNYINYEKQIWVVKKENQRLYKLLQKFETEYPNIEIILWEDARCTI